MILVRSDLGQILFDLHPLPSVSKHYSLLWYPIDVASH